MPSKVLTAFSYASIIGALSLGTFFPPFQAGGMCRYGGSFPIACRWAPVSWFKLTTTYGKRLLAIASR